MKFIDIHGHYAWDIDDGMRFKEETIDALKLASKQGIDEIVATPHMCCGKDDNKEAILERLDELKVLGMRMGIKIHMGCELMLNSHVSDALKFQHYIPIANSKYLLCEDNVRKNNDDFVEFFDIYVKEVIMHGYTPIIAHVERYFHTPIDLDYVRYLIDLGCIIQVNTTSILGQCHPQHHENVMKLLDEQLVHIIATDSHRSEAPRCPNMLDCYYYLLNEGYLQRYIDLLMYENPKRVVYNRHILKPHFKKVRNKLKKLFAPKIKTR